MIELFKGRPATDEGRLAREIRVYDYLDNLGIEYYRTDHEAVDTMEKCLEIDSVLGATICKNLFLCNRQQTDFYLLMMPGDKPFKTKELSAQIGSSRLSFASSEKMLEYLDIQPGAVSVMGLMNDTENKVQLLVKCRKIKKVYRGRFYHRRLARTRYDFTFEFTDITGKTRKFHFEDTIHGHEINVLKERIENARE